jgi:hypothetical protein
MRSIGPFQEEHSFWGPPKITDEAAEVLLDKGYLGIGLDSAAAALIHLHSRKRPQGSIRSGPSPFPQRDIDASKAIAANLQLSLDEERAIGGVFPALLSYLSIVQNNKSLSSILMAVVDRPSLFSLAKNLGTRKFDLSLEGGRKSSLPASAWGLSENIPVYEIPMLLSLNDHPSLRITMVVTAPRPPLLACAGIIGALAEKPEKSGAYLTVRVISARLGTGRGA